MDDIRTLRAKLMDESLDTEAFQAVFRTLAEEGRLLQATFEISYGHQTADLGPGVVKTLREVFMAGASSVAADTFDFLNHGRAPNEDERRRLQSVADELKEWQVAQIIANPRALEKAVRQAMERRR